MDIFLHSNYSCLLIAKILFCLKFWFAIAVVTSLLAGHAAALSERDLLPPMTVSLDGNVTESDRLRLEQITRMLIKGASLSVNDKDWISERSGRWNIYNQEMKVSEFSSWMNDFHLFLSDYGNQS